MESVALQQPHNGLHRVRRAALLAGCSVWAIIAPTRTIKLHPIIIFPIDFLRRDPLLISVPRGYNPNLTNEFLVPPFQNQINHLPRSMRYPPGA
jgi:hypothetical protein